MDSTFLSDEASDTEVQPVAAAPATRGKSKWDDEDAESDGDVKVSTKLPPILRQSHPDSPLDRIRGALRKMKVTRRRRP